MPRGNEKISLTFVYKKRGITEDLKQGNMIVEQYSAEFLKLSRYAPHLILDEQTKAERFHDGLSPRIRERIIFLEITDYVKMVHTATMAKKGIREAAAYYINRKRSMSTESLPLPSPSKRHYAGCSSSGSFGRRNAPASRVSVCVSQCSKCGKAHDGDCMTGSRACFRCGKLDHFAWQCLTGATRIQRTQASDNQLRPIAKAKVYMRTPDNVKADENVANVGTGAMLLIVVLLVSCLI
jgi:hypothetical protein